MADVTREDIRRAALSAGQDPAIVDAIVRGLPAAMWWSSEDGSSSGMVAEIPACRVPPANWPHYRARSVW